MSNVSFPAAHLSAYDIGHRIQFLSPEGAKITDELTRLVAGVTADGETVLRLFLKNTAPANAQVLGRGIDDYGFLVKPDQMVKRVNK